MVAAQRALAIDEHPEVLPQRPDLPHSHPIRAARLHAVEPRTTEAPAPALELERTTERARSQHHGRVAVGHREHDLHARRELARHVHGHVEPRVDRAIVRTRERPEPARVLHLAVGLAQGDHLALHAERGLQRRERKVQLVDLAADRGDQQREGEVRGKVRARPHVHRVVGGVLVEVADLRIHVRAREPFARELREPGDQPDALRIALDREPFARRDLFVGRVADPLFTHRPHQPRDLGAPMRATEDPDQSVDDPRTEPRDDRSHARLDA